MLGAVGAGAWLDAFARRRRQPAPYDYRGKVALVTGGSRGLGFVVARMLAERGAHVAICARDEEELLAAAQDLRGHGGEPLAIPCDLTQFDQVQSMIRQIERNRGPLDILINNASIIQVGPLESMTLDDFHAAMAANFWSAVHTVLAALPTMKERRQGRIVNVSSIGGKVSVPHLLPYSAAKFAVVGFSQGLRAELAKDGSVVTTICPGLMRTGSPRHAVFKGKNESEYFWFSVSDTLPLLTVSAETAAEEILEACARGEAERVISLPAQVAVTLNGLFPGLTSALLEVANGLLPGLGGMGTEARAGMDSQSSWSPSILTTLNEQAAKRNNEMRRTSHEAVR
jgi:NAD(P)-dependent dehydrogenase (short-subunit alcohol dehydrogenase family)